MNPIPKTSIRMVLLAMSFWPLFHILIAASVFFLNVSLNLKIVIAALLFYGIPPFLNRLLFAVAGKPIGVFKMGSKEFGVWFLSSQLQVNFVRFPFTEELLRVIPRVYSFWLRCWGSKIGKAVTWTAQVRVLDRALIEVKDFAVMGFASTLTSHFVIATKEGIPEVTVGIPVVGVRAIVGGESGMGPGSEVADFEMLTSTYKLPPGMIWKDGRPRRREGA